MTDPVERQQLLALAMRLEEEDTPPCLSETEGEKPCLAPQEILENIPTSDLMQKILTGDGFEEAWSNV